MKIIKKIALLMADLEMKQKNIIEQTGLASSKLSKMINGSQQIIGNDLYLLSKALRVEPKYLQDEEEYEPARLVPVIGSASCGVPDGSIDDISDMHLIPNQLFTQTAYIVVADGDSMTPEIDSGDLLICDYKDIAEGDRIHYYIESTNESGVKRYGKAGEHIMLSADNTAYKPIILNKEDAIKATRVMAIIKPAKLI
jgi:repressor LexA